MYIKSDSEEIILKLATYGQREKAFLLSSKLCPQWIVCPAQGYIHMVKHEKNVYIKSDFKAIFMPRHQKVAGYYVIPSEILSVRPSVRPSVCLSVRPSVRLSVRPSAPTTILVSATPPTVLGQSF